MNKHTKIVVGIVAAVGVVAVVTGAFIYSGIYNIGADDHHTKPMYAALNALRERSIEVRARNIPVPNLDDPKMIAEGAEHYTAMCTGCHLAPGMKESDSEIRPGLYPQPPNLVEHGVHDPREAFWVIKHGVKMSGMPAWGTTHSDEAIWNMVAFIRKMPGMTPEQYKALAGDSAGEGHAHGHEHGGEAHDHGVAPEAGHDHGDEDHEHTHDEAAETPLSLDGLTPKAVPAAEAVAEAFHAALQRGDRQAALAVLAPEVTISEGGETQSRDTYAGGHLGEDIAFLKSAKVTPVSLGSMAMGDTAMVGSETQILTTLKGKPATIRSREMLNLKKDGATWKIVSIQWQSAPVTEP
ncbi:cytochrome C [Dyella jiangningensis]|nr:cytochrome C [Dyella jiangningensis]AHX13413.1 cytochrome C [Dyella jiangningensis]